MQVSINFILDYLDTPNFKALNFKALNVTKPADEYSVEGYCI